MTPFEMVFTMLYGVTSIFLIAWAFVGVWWFGVLVKLTGDFEWSHILMGGPFIWFYLACIIAWIIGLGFYAIYTDTMDVIHRWSIRPVDRALNQYLTNGGCHG